MSIIKVALDYVYVDSYLETLGHFFITRIILWIYDPDKITTVTKQLQTLFYYNSDIEFVCCYTGCFVFLAKVCIKTVCSSRSKS